MQLRVVKAGNAQLPLSAFGPNREVTLERRRLTLAHELGHRLIGEKSPVDHEKAATIFAGAFLVLRDHLVREIGRHRKGLGYQELIHLKRMYRVSASALLVRLRQIGVIDESTLAYSRSCCAYPIRL